MICSVDEGILVVWNWNLSVVDAVVGGLTLAAVIVALWQVGVARKEANRTREDMIRERRLQWELSILAALYEQWSTTGSSHLRGHVSALIQTESSPDLPLLRATLGVKPPQDATGLRETYRTQSPEFKAAVEDEIDLAIQRRVAAGREEG